MNFKSLPFVEGCIQINLESINILELLDLHFAAFVKTTEFEYRNRSCGDSAVSSRRTIAQRQTQNSIQRFDLLIDGAGTTRLKCDDKSFEISYVILYLREASSNA